ncbi:YetF domain-containing protein [Nocardioides sp.]|uniref:DUF421 domain-containing protein n=1 Tax=Nocardioides sp. TaxID=35761 RepID=UPI00286DDEBD|nr:YetF domain-containing protein [Nocardioides sp.]
MWELGVNPLELVARTTIIYVLFLGALRLSGKREIGQFTLFDLAMVLLVANALQPAMTGADQSVLGGAIILATIFVLNRLVSEARVRVPFVRRVLEFKSTTIGRDGKWLKAEFARQGIDLGDADAALRQHGLEHVEQMKLATLEEDGSISIVAADDGASVEVHRRSRRSRL